MDKVFVISQIAVISQQMSNIKHIIEDMDMRLGELYDDLYFDDVASEIKHKVDNASLDLLDYMRNEDEEDEIIYDTLRNKKTECMCDDCWGVSSDPLSEWDKMNNDSFVKNFAKYYRKTCTCPNCDRYYWLAIAFDDAPSDYRMD